MTLALYTPECRDLWFKQQMMADEETMSYNHAYGGTIPFPESLWQAWHDKWITKANGKRYYRYLRDESKAFIGEISYRYDEDRQLFLADIVIFAKYRGKGYGSIALDLLCAAARENGISALYDDIAADNPAIGLFLRHGFQEIARTQEHITVWKTL